MHVHCGMSYMMSYGTYGCNHSQVQYATAQFLTQRMSSASVTIQCNFSRLIKTATTLVCQQSMVCQQPRPWCVNKAWCVLNVRLQVPHANSSISQSTLTWPCMAKGSAQQHRSTPCQSGQLLGNSKSSSRSGISTLCYQDHSNGPGKRAQHLL